MNKRDLVIIVAAGTIGFLGGILGGMLTGDIHVYIDSFTGPGHVAGEMPPAGSSATE